MLELFKRHLAAFESADWNAYKAYFAPDLLYEEVATGKTTNGIDAYLALVKQWKTAFPDLKATIQQFYSLEDTAVAEILWEGTQRGPLESPAGTMQPTNKFGSVRAVLISKMRDGKVTESRHYFDLMTVLRQLQAATVSKPESQAAAQRAIH